MKQSELEKLEAQDLRWIPFCEMDNYEFLGVVFAPYGDWQYYRRKTDGAYVRTYFSIGD